MGRIRIEGRVKKFYKNYNEPESEKFRDEYDEALIELRDAKETGDKEGMAAAKRKLERMRRGRKPWNK